MPRKLTTREARAMAAARKTIAGGRPAKGERCRCGKMSAARAKARYHVCGPNLGTLGNAFLPVP